jgi:galactose mutarotase-like enzyme
VSASASVERRSGEAAVVLRAGDWEAVFLPDLGMLGTSLCVDGEELLALPGGVSAYRRGHTTGLPLLYPWANRLSARRYVAAGHAVDLRGVRLHVDERGLPIHGTMAARPGWRVTSVGSTARVARLSVAFDFGAHEDLLASFPYPHELTVDVEVGAGGLRMRTTVHASAGVAVPVSFGWHPYLRLPATAKRRASVHRPPGAEVRLDRRGIPTGAATPVDAATIPLAGADLDDLFALGPERRFRLRSPQRTITLDLDEGYRYAQVFSPTRKSFCCIEPMTAPTNALVSGDAPVVRKGSAYSAGFRVGAR